MNADSLLLSDVPPQSAPQAAFGGRFQYWRGRSGERYLFSAVPFDTLADFRSAVVILAEPTHDGRFLAWNLATIDRVGRLTANDAFWPTAAPPGSLAFVHFLAESEAERRALVADLAPEPVDSFNPPAEFDLAA